MDIQQRWLRTSWHRGCSLDLIYQVGRCPLSTGPETVSIIHEIESLYLGYYLVSKDKQFIPNRSINLYDPVAMISLKRILPYVSISRYSFLLES